MQGLRKFYNDYFISDKLPFESRTLNFVTLFGAIASALALLSRIIAGVQFISSAPIIVMIIAILGILYISINNTRSAKFLTTVIVCGVSIVFWPLSFFTIGGPTSGMAVYFALAIILDFTLLRRKTRLFAIITTIVIMVICYASTLFWGWDAYVLPSHGLTVHQQFIDLIQSILIVGFLTSFIILYQTKLFQNEKEKVEAANEEIRHNEELMKLINEAAVVLLTAEPDKFEAALLESMEKIAVCMDIDCIYIWRAGERDGTPVYIRLYEWLSPDIDGTKTFESVSGSNVLPRSSELDDMLLSEEGYLSGTADTFTGLIHDILIACGAKTIMGFPAFFQGEYWGFVSFENRHGDKLCSEREAPILQSGSLLLTNAIERNESSMQLTRAQATVSAMFESSPHINILFDSTFRVTDCNPAALSFMGFDTKEEMITGFVPRMIKSIPETQPDGRPSVPLAVRLVTAAKEGYVKFETELHIGGEIRILNCEFKRIPYEGSFAIVAYVFDMTEIHEREMELKRRDQQLREAVEEAKAANRAKSAFLSTMSHEIRTPMNAILGIAEIQLDVESHDVSVKEAFSKIYSSGDMLLGIINDILDLSKIESGKLELIVDKYESASLISDTAQLNMMRIGSKPIEFELSVNENLPVVLSGDELRVKQIFNNILSNAFKYTAAGKVKLSISAEESRGDDDTVVLVASVSDTGQGMTKEQIDKLFDEYSRFNMAANRTTEGTGLGMSITQNLLRLMNGDITVESEPGKGSTFTARIPQGRMDSNVLGKEMAENLQQFRTSSRAQMRRVQITRDPMPYGSVLIVDDVETNIYVAKGLLAPYKLKIDSTESGFGTIERIKAGNVYDIIFMDHMMPQMDGIEATKIIREMGYDRPVVALTANAVLGQADMFLGNGFDDFISKPIDVRQLNSILNKLIRDKQPPEVIEAAMQETETEKEQSESVKTLQSAIDTHFAEIFVRDANKSIIVMEELIEKNSWEDDTLRSYTIHIHGMKSALANIGETKLSSFALKLEEAGRDNKTDFISTETPIFLGLLRTLVNDLTPEEDSGGIETADEDRPWLLEKLREIKEACDIYDKKTAKDVTSELRDKPWSHPTKEMLDTVAEQLLHSAFDEVGEIIDLFLETQ